jgi:hypothetical protein
MKGDRSTAASLMHPTVIYAQHDDEATNQITVNATVVLELIDFNFTPL